MASTITSVNDDITNDANEFVLTAANLNIAPGAGGLLPDGLVSTDADGGNGDDLLYGTDASEVINGFGGNDTIVGGDTPGVPDSDTLIGGAGNDSITAGEGGDVLQGDSGNDTLGGSSGRDTARYRFDDASTFAGGVASAVTFDASAVTNEAFFFTIADGYGGTDTITNVEVFHVVGTAFADRITGSSVDDLISGRGGNDTLAGGIGNDTVTYADAGGAVIVHLGNGTAGGADGSDTLSGFEAAVGSGFGDTIVGGAGNETLTGGAGNDSLVGGGGLDTVRYDTAATASAVIVNLSTGVVTGGAGADTVAGIEAVVGSSFGDSITGGTTPDTLEGLEGSDTLRGGGGVDELIGGVGNDVLDGGSGEIRGQTFDLASYRDATTGVNVSLATGRSSGGAGNDTLVGIEGVVDSAFDDTITGSSLADLIVASRGADLLDGGAGYDILQFSDVIDGVIVNLATGRANPRFGEDGEDTISGFEGIVGSRDSDALTGDAGDNLIRGGLGNDDIDGGDGIDTAAYDFASGPVTVDLTGLVGLASGADGSDELFGIENLRGSGHADDLRGDDEPNLLEGGAGNDTLRGNGGRDTLVGAAGNDSLDGGEILDRIFYSDGNVASWATAPAAVVINAATGVVQDGQGGTDTLENISSFVGSSFNDRITGSSGDLFERFEPGPGIDTIDGGAITDRIGYTDGNLLSYESATGAIAANLASGTTAGAAGADVFSNINALRGGRFADTLRGSDSDIEESFEGGAGNDAIHAGRGRDQLAFDHSPAAVVASLVTGKASDGHGGTDTFTGIERLRGSAFNDTLTGGNTANGTGERDGFESFAGLAGNDRIDGGAGYDVADYSGSPEGVDVTLGGAGEGSASDGHGGTDTLVDIEAIRGSRFFDYLQGSDGGPFESFDGGDGPDTIDGMGGLDRVDYYGDPDSVFVDLDIGIGFDGFGWRDTLRGIEDIRGSLRYGDKLTGNDANNAIEGLGGNDTLEGWEGNDTLDGGAGADRMVGGEGDDTYLVDAATDRVIEAVAAGTDVVQASVTWTLPVNVENLVLTGTGGIGGTGNVLANTLTGNAGANRLDGGAGNDTLRGNAGNDTLLGADGDDVLDGGTGADAMTGGAGNDVYVVDAGSDVVTEAEGAGTDMVRAGVTHVLAPHVENLTLTGELAINGSGNALANAINGNAAANMLWGADGIDTLGGGVGNDTLIGGGAGDRLDGGSGDDELRGGVAGDTLVGGAGADRFVFDAASGSDTVTDFVSGLDDLVFNAVALRVGNSDGTIDGAVSVGGPGGFDTSAEVVIVTTNIVGPITTATAAAAIGSASGSYAVGRKALFAVDNGSSTSLYLFSALDADAQVEAAELALLATLGAAPATAIGDYVFVTA